MFSKSSQSAGVFLIFFCSALLNLITGNRSRQIPANTSQRAEQWSIWN